MVGSSEKKRTYRRFSLSRASPVDRRIYCEGAIGGVSVALAGRCRRGWLLRCADLRFRLLKCAVNDGIIFGYRVYRRHDKLFSYCRGEQCAHEHESLEDGRI